jgi:hypothetical protein
VFDDGGDPPWQVGELHGGRLPWADPKWE